MRLLPDASTAINLLNADVLDILLHLSETIWFIGPLVLTECQRDGVTPPVIQQAIDNGLIRVLDDTTISGQLFLRYARLYGLGDGETECLTFAAGSDFVVCCDDRRARQMLKRELGPERLTGSLGLLRDAVLQGLISSGEALARYRAMKAAGGFVPEIDETFFDRLPRSSP